MRTVVNDRQTIQFVQLWDVDQPSRLHPPSWLISPSKQVGLHHGKLLPHPRQNLLQIAQLDRLFGEPEKGSEICLPLGVMICYIHLYVRWYQIQGAALAMHPCCPPPIKASLIRAWPDPQPQVGKIRTFPQLFLTFPYVFSSFWSSEG